MFTVISPAKKLDFESPISLSATAPQLLSETRELAQTTRRLKAADLARLMKLSGSLAKLNFERFQALDLSSSKPSGSRPAALAFDGDTYSGLRASEFSPDDMEFAQAHLGILSGLYGLLRPRDAILPYRLEMGTKLGTSRGKNLYDFWGDRVVEQVHKQLTRVDSDVLVNLASREYFAVVDRPTLRAQVITPVFKELRDGVPKIISFSAKKARGSMARSIVVKRWTRPQALQKFQEDGYRFVKSESTDTQWLFLREAK